MRIGGRFGVFACLIVIFLLCNVSALSNESVQSVAMIKEARVCLENMAELGIPTARANSSYTDAIQLYSAQVALEEKKRDANYKVVDSIAKKVCDIRDISLKADEELKVFLDSYKTAAESANLSEMDEEYFAITTSYSEERFEDTVELVKIGYSKISEIQSKQTALRLFYDATSRTLKAFFINNWKKLSIIFTVLLVLLVIFWTGINQYIIRMKMKHLIAQKESINSLIKELQKNYFKLQNISESEYTVKMNRYKEMILDIERQIPLLQEDMARLKGKVTTSELLPDEQIGTDGKRKYISRPREVKIERVSVREIKKEIKATKKAKRKVKKEIKKAKKVRERKKR